MNSVLAAAWTRALVGGVLVGAASGLSVYQGSGYDIRAAVIAAVSTALGYWIVRGGFEGTIDHAASSKR
jgi:hypothetical protein